MVSIVQNVAVDCANAYELALFWSSVTGRPLHPDCKPGHLETLVLLAEGPVLYFNQVPETKTIKNRIHLCLRPETTRDATAIPTARAGRSSPIPKATSSASCTAMPTTRPRTPRASAADQAGSGMCIRDRA